MAGELLVWLHGLAHPCEDGDENAIDAEIEAYCTKSSNPFAGVSKAEFKANHPSLSQSASCLCKQVEKCASKIGGSDNFILRLNALMMEEFTKLGDQIYQPIQI